MHVPIISVCDCKNAPTYTQPQYPLVTLCNGSANLAPTHCLWDSACMSGHPCIESVTTLPNILDTSDSGSCSILTGTDN